MAKQDLIEYLSRVGKQKHESWVELALMFGLSDGERARKTWLKHRKESIHDKPKDTTKTFVDPYKEFMGTSHYAPYVTSTGYSHTAYSSPTKDSLETITDTIKSIVGATPIEDLLSFRRALDSGKDNKYLLELAIFDLHIGKLATKEECGEDYDIEIAAKRYTDAVTNLLSRVDKSSIDRILLPIGNDFIHVDNKRYTTTAGTHMEYSGTYTQMIKVGKSILIDTINKLSILASIDVVVIPGNHDNNTMYAIGEILKAYYHNDSRITIDNSSTPRKYYSYHQVAIQFTHGNDEKHSDLPLIFATEKPQLWGLSTHRYIQIGHLHKGRKTSYLSVDSKIGVELQIIPSLSATDTWHNNKGYISTPQAKAFLFDKDNGLISEFTYNV